MMDLLKRMDSHRYLYLTRLEEPEVNALLLQIEEGRVVQEGPTSPDVKSIQGAPLLGNPIIADERSAAYEVRFESYVAYAVRNESFTIHDPNEAFDGRLCGQYSKSAFLDFVGAATIATPQYPGPLKHYGFNCLDHIIDIVTTAEPSIQLLRSGLRVDA